jgi:peptide/nickel transport system permease protein
VNRFILRRLAVIPGALLLVNFFGYAYAHLVLPIRASRIPYLVGAPPEPGPLLPSYAAYLRGALRFDFGFLPGEEGVAIASLISEGASTSLVLLSLALALSVLLGLGLGLRAVRSRTRTIARWLTVLSTAGLSTPSFYIGSLLMVGILYYAFRQGIGGSFLRWGFGWDIRLVLPAVALMTRPTVQIAQMTAGLLSTELGKRHIAAARSVGHTWHTVRQRHALRSILAPVILAIAGSFRLLMGELILVEWLFNWPGLGRLFAMALVPGQFSVAMGSPLFLDPPVVATVLTAFAALFLVTDLAAAVLVRVFDPRLRAPQEGTGSADVVSSRAGLARRNWPLLLGGLVVLLVVGIAVAGPALAPHDPLEQHTIVRAGEHWYTAPLPAFTIPGFPLGSDAQGRDFLSRLLWAIRPTLVMVAIVAFARLVLGTLIGLASGWSNGRLGRILDTAIGGALAVPVLMVALGAIAAVGIEIGLLAFIVGLSVTGWAETARIVRERTRLVKGQQYVEAARGLGASDLRILFRHVVRQVMPLVWALFSLEVSGTMMATASLGFLGYYIGGDVWIEVADWVAQKFSGMPELGQMLATANTGVRRLGIADLPWAMLFVGTAIFIIVLGFNLLGEGLRRQMTLEDGARRTVVSLLARRASVWVGERALPRLSVWGRKHALPVGVALLLVVFVGGGLVWWRVQAARLPEVPAVALEIPGDHLWAMERRDFWGTRWVEGDGLGSPEILWTFEDLEGLAGGPAVSADGTVYVASKGGMLHALDADGNPLWQAPLPAKGVNTPALGAGGEIYVVDKKGGLSAFGATGDLLWQLQLEEETVATTGPVVVPDGTIYYGVGRRIQAVSSDGTLLWSTQVPSYDLRIMPPQLGPGGEFLYWEDTVFDARDGSVLDVDVPDEVEQYIVGADGRTYFRVRHNVTHWRWNESGVELIETTRWDFRMLGTFVTPVDAGVTHGRVVWLFYSNPYRGSRFVWLDTSGRVFGALWLGGRGRMLGIDQDATAYVCVEGTRDYHSPGLRCAALAPRSDEPIWEIGLEMSGRRVLGGALVPGRLYVTVDGLEGGCLYALGE